MGRDLGGFQDQMARRLTGRISWRILNGKWENTLEDAARVEAGFETMETCIIQSPNILKRDRLCTYVSIFTEEGKAVESTFHMCSHTDVGSTEQDLVRFFKHKIYSFLYIDE